MSDEPLKFEGDFDYTMLKDEFMTWITVENISIHIVKQNDRGCVKVELFPLGQENIENEPLDFARAYFDEAAQKIKEQDDTSQNNS